MTQILAEILKGVEQLSIAEKAELADRLAERLGDEIPPEVELAHLDVVKQRIADVASGQVELIPGAEALAQVRRSISQPTK